MDAHASAILLNYANRLDNAGHGQKKAIVAEAMAELGCSRPALYLMLAEVRPSARKRRADAGQSGLTLAEAKAIAAYLMEGYNQIQKKGRTLDETVRVLRAEDRIKAARLDKEGVWQPLSLSAIGRAMAVFGYHPEQLNRPTPHITMSYPHPNHTHQVDSSTGTVYYLEDGTSVYEMDSGTHYKNKPWNIEAVSEFRVIRYALTDMCSGVVRFHYYPKSENARHTVDFLARVWAPKNSPHDPFHGVPKYVYCDKGIANALVRRFCERLGVELITHKPKNSRASGGVEGAHNYAVEMPFEHGLRDVRDRINGFDDLNRIAARWQLWWNATKEHGRHGLSRFAAWMHIKEEELRTTCDYQTLLTLATERPKKCQVRGDKTAHFRGRLWDVSDVPGLMIKGEVFLHWHPFIADCAMAVYEGEDGHERHIQLRDVTGQVDPAQGKWGYKQNAVEFGKKFNATADTDTDKKRKEIRLLASGSTTHKEDEAKRRKKGFTAFDGGINPYKKAEEAELPTFIKKRGTALPAPAAVETLPLTMAQAIKILKPQLEALGVMWTADHLSQLKRRWPEGLREAELSEALDMLHGVKDKPKPKLYAVR